MSTITTISTELTEYIDENKRYTLPRFFKTGKGQYGEGDKFLGITVPNIRKVAKKHLQADINDLWDLLQSPWHEERMCGLIIMVERVKLTSTKSFLNTHTEEDGEEIRRKYYKLYLDNINAINNWDLVDLTAPTLVGSYLINKDRWPLYELAQSKNVWEQRIAIVSTLTFIRLYDFDDIYTLTELLIHHPHDLMQKAMGWMLREAGKRDKNKLIAFLELHAHEMPRTMLRYSIEKLSNEERQYFMNKK